MKKHICILIITTFVFCLTGCEKTPMQKLKSNTKYPELEDIWDKEMKDKTDLWKEALAYCKQHVHQVNCTPLILTNELNSANSIVTGRLNEHPLNLKW